MFISRTVISVNRWGVCFTQYWHMVSQNHSSSSTLLGLVEPSAIFEVQSTQETRKLWEASQEHTELQLWCFEDVYQKFNWSYCENCLVLMVNRWIPNREASISCCWLCSCIRLLMSIALACEDELSIDSSVVIWWSCLCEYGFSQRQIIGKATSSVTLYCKSQSLSACACVSCRKKRRT